MLFKMKKKRMGEIKHSKNEAESPDSQGMQMTCLCLPCNQHHELQERFFQIRVLRK